MVPEPPSTEDATYRGVAMMSRPARQLRHRRGAQVRLLSSGRARAGRRRRGDYSPSGSLDPWAATAKIGSSTWAEGQVLRSLQEQTPN
ncbi:hypothetical protein Taro_002170, partial [Colocasia esculenta]|nr:hypothetical protein [Colocasia esculenta]